MFRNRDDAARQLAHALGEWKGTHPVVYAIPRGAILMAKLIAEQLGGELDVVLTHKLGAPGSPEFGIGAVAESGWHFLQKHLGMSSIDEAYISNEIAAQLAMLRRRRKTYAFPSISARGRVAIVVDDGLATGSTMIAALHALRQQEPQLLICAVPVAASESLDLVRPLADKVVCLHALETFCAVSLHYGEFAQVQDHEVVAALAAARAPSVHP